MRVFCDSCMHAHAVLPDVIVPYSSYSLLFILFILGEYFAGLHTLEQLCERFDVSAKQFHKWLALWNSHKEQWLGMLDASETDNNDFSSNSYTWSLIPALPWSSSGSLPSHSCSPTGILF